MGVRFQLAAAQLVVFCHVSMRLRVASTSRNGVGTLQRAQHGGPAVSMVSSAKHCFGLAYDRVRAITSSLGGVTMGDGVVLMVV
jgi:hypothetical protein